MRSDRRLSQLAAMTVAGFAIVCAIAVLTGCGGGGRADSDASEDSFASLVVTPVTRRDWTSLVESTGQIEPIRVLTIKSKASGEILRLPVETGEMVSAGALLAQIDTTEAATLVRQHSAELDYQRALLAVASRNSQQATDLFSKGFISQEECDTQQLEYARIRSTLYTTEALLAEAEEQLSESTVKAPVAGRIIEKKVEEGQIITSATRGVGEGTTLFRMADLSKVWVRVMMDQADLGKIRVGQEATVVPEALRSQRYYGRVTRLEPLPAIEDNVKYFPVLVEIDNRDGFLLPGMDCAVTINISSLSSVLTVASDAVIELDEAAELAPILDVPLDSINSAIRRAGGKPAEDSPQSAEGENASMHYRSGVERVDQEIGPIDAAIVFVVDTTNHRVLPTPIKIGLQDWNLTEVVSGLQPGMTAVIPPSAAIVEQFEAFRRQMGLRGRK